jgi:hypothetical protein
MTLLDNVAQPGSTQWSIVYDLTTGSIRIAMGADYQTIHTLELPLSTP